MCFLWRNNIFVANWKSLPIILSKKYNSFLARRAEMSQYKKNCFQISASGSYLHLIAKTLLIDRASLDSIPHLIFNGDTSTKTYVFCIKNEFFSLDKNLCKFEVFLKSEKKMEDNLSMILFQEIYSIVIILYLNICWKCSILFVIIVTTGMYASLLTSFRYLIYDLYNPF